MKANHGKKVMHIYENTGENNPRLKIKTLTEISK